MSTNASAHFSFTIFFLSLVNNEEKKNSPKAVKFNPFDGARQASAKAHVCETVASLFSRAIANKNNFNNLLCPVSRVSVISATNNVDNERATRGGPWSALTAPTRHRYSGARWDSTVHKALLQ